MTGINSQPKISGWMKQFLPSFIALLFSFSASFGQNTYTYPAGPFAAVYDGELIEADYWDLEPKILSAGVGFCDIVAVDTNLLDQNVVALAEGAWLSDITCASNTADFTSTSLRNQVQTSFIFQNEAWELEEGAIGLDGLPVTFSWPVLSHTVDVTDFQFILNTGDTIQAYMTGLWPNFENNERNCVVLFGEFANRKMSTDPDARFPVKCEIVDDGSPLLFAGPDGQIVSGVGLSWETTTNPYDPDNGPRLIGAKLNHVGSQNEGEGTSNALFNTLNAALPNDEFALYGGGDFRLRMLTSGGFSPDGVRGIKPNEFERFFRLHALAPDSSDMLLEQTDTVYTLLGGTLKIIGLSDLGQSSESYDDCYDEDRDNYIDVILEGDEAAARNLTFLEIPSLAGGYDPLYTPGGPGTTPFPGVIYTSPGPPDLEPVMIALDDPWRVTADSTIVLGLNEFEQEEDLFVAYPNPTAENLRILTEPGFNGHFEIADLNGTLLLQTEEYHINVKQFEDGMYLLVKRNADGSCLITRFIKRSL